MMNDVMRKRLQRLSTTNLADALDALGLPGATWGIRPMWEGAGRILGCAVTVKITAAGPTSSRHHLGVAAIAAAGAGEVILIDNNGRLDTSCWGGILATAAAMKKISGVVIDGACRDLDECLEIGFPVYARGAVVATARGRIMEEETNIPVQFGGVRVDPGDVVAGDRSGVVVIPAGRAMEVIEKAESLQDREQSMIAELRAGVSILEVDEKYRYETMIRR